jgi:hypothetical protein
MKPPPMRTARRRALSALLLCLYLPSCTFWQTTSTPLPELTGPPDPPPLVRITPVTGERIEVQDPRVHGDSLIGGTIPDTGWAFLALADIKKVEIRKRSVPKTVLAVVLLAGLAYGIAVLCTDVGECTSE